MVNSKRQQPRGEILDPRKFSFTHAYGYEKIPDMLKLESFPDEARTRVWNVLYRYIERDREYGVSSWWLSDDWEEISKDLHADYDGLSLDKWTGKFSSNCENLQYKIRHEPFNRVFDLILYVMRHPKCPNGLVEDMQRAFRNARLAYVLTDDPPTIVPATTEEEGEAIVESYKTLIQAGLNASVAHLRQASECVNRGDWAGSVRESINAVESVARQLDPDGAGTLSPALASIEQQGRLHPALKIAFDKLYGYTSNEQGIRHALLDRATAAVGLDEAVFMLGACASFASYLARKHAAQSSSSAGSTAG